MRIKISLLMAVFAVLAAFWIGQQRTQVAADRTLEWRTKAETDAWLRYLSGNGVDLRALVGMQPFPEDVRQLIDAYVPSTDVFMFHIFDVEGVLKGQFASKGRAHAEIHAAVGQMPQTVVDGGHDHSVHADHAHQMHGQDGYAASGHAGRDDIIFNAVALSVGQTGKPHLHFGEARMPDGSSLTYAEGYFPLRNGAQIIGVIETFIDVTKTNADIASLFQDLALEVGALTVLMLLIPLLSLVHFATVLLKTNEAAEIAKKTAERAETAQANFLANMSHEIRTPMNGVVASIDLLERSKMTPEQAALVGTLSKSSSSLLDIINDILDFSKIEADQIELRAEPFDPVELLENALALFGPSAHQKGLGLYLDCDLDPTIWLTGDAGRLRQCCLNLIGNAIKFTETGWIIVTLRLTEAGVLTIDVTDTGIGIQPAKLDAIFDPFEQADTGRARMHEGTGLGLAITRRLLMQMGGTITAADRVDGAQFRIQLPLPSQPAPEQVCTHWYEVKEKLGRRRMAIEEVPPHLSSAVRSLAVSLGLEICSSSEPGAGGLPVLSCDVDDAGVLSIRAHEEPCALSPPWDRTGFTEAALDLTGQRSVRKADATPSEAASGEVDLAGLTILVVEDNKTNRLVLERMLQPTGAKLVMAENGAIGVESFKKSPVGLVFMDMSMPVMDGVTATRAIRRWETKTARPQTPIIALTAHAHASDRAKCLSAGMNAFLTKPLKREALQAGIFEVIGCDDRGLRSS